MAPAPQSSTASDRRRVRVLVLATEDWFVVSHFQPLLRALAALGAEVVVATRYGEKRDDIAATGARTVDFHFDRGALRPDRDAAALLRLRRLLARERPDIVHAVALKPIVLAGLAALPAPARGLVLNLTGVGFAGTSRAGAPIFAAALRLIARLLRRPGTRLIVENAEDAARLQRLGAVHDSRRVALIAGAGVNPTRFARAAPADPASAGFVGRMIWSKGVDVLVEAQQLLRRRGVDIALTLAGSPDPANPRALSPETLHAWGARPGIRWLDHVTDVAGFWRQTAIAVVPSRGGEGMPRALLEAAACGRPLIVSDVPGCRDFVRHEVEGLIVPPDDPAALADALARLAGDASLAHRLGAAARERVLQAYTEAHVEAALTRLYRELLPDRFA